MRTRRSAIPLAAMACDVDVEPPPPARVVASPDAKLPAEAGATFRFEARESDAQGKTHPRRRRSGRSPIPPSRSATPPDGPPPRAPPRCGPPPETPPARPTLKRISPHPSAASRARPVGGRNRCVGRIVGDRHRPGDRGSRPGERFRGAGLAPRLFVEAARTRVAEDRGRGLYVDLNGRGHSVPRVELGCPFTGDDLSRSDAQSNAPRFPERSPAGPTAPSSNSCATPRVLGALLSEAGVATVPSPTMRTPGRRAILQRLRHARRHGSPGGGVRIEMHRAELGDAEANRRRGRSSSSWKPASGSARSGPDADRARKGFPRGPAPDGAPPEPRARPAGSSPRPARS